jgi:hypothetical protein
VGRLNLIKRKIKKLQEEEKLIIQLIEVVQNISILSVFFESRNVLAIIIVSSSVPPMLFIYGGIRRYLFRFKKNINFLFVN